MADSPNTLLGMVLNKHLVADVVTHKGSATNISKGAIVYQDAANGVKVVPTTGVDATRIRFLNIDLTNSGGAVGDKEVETYKSGALVVAKADGAIVVGDRVKFGSTTAGRVEKLAKPANAALNTIFSDTEVEAALDAIRDYDANFLGIYIGHPSERTKTNNDPTDAADGDEVVILMR